MKLKHLIKQLQSFEDKGLGDKDVVIVAENGMVLSGTAKVEHYDEHRYTFNIDETTIKQIVLTQEY